MSSTKISSKCPAFTDGCPFKELSSDATAILQKVQECPAFANKACPFKDATTVADAVEIFRGMPDIKEHATALESMGFVHEVYGRVQFSLGQSCPVFSTSCPFKSISTSLDNCDWGSLVNQVDRSVDQEAKGSAAGPAGPAAPDDPEPEGLSKRYDPHCVLACLTRLLPVATAAQSPHSLKVGTADAHKAAENVQFVRQFIKGKVPRPAYEQVGCMCVRAHALCEGAAV
jgi:hypothetical protein